MRIMPKKNNVAAEHGKQLKFKCWPKSLCISIIIKV